MANFGWGAYKPEGNRPAASIPRVWITELLFSDGTHLPVSQNDIVVVVGPNNSGKSEALRAIREKLEDRTSVSPVIQRISIGRSGGASDVADWLQGWTTERIGIGNDVILEALGHSIRAQGIEHEWQENDAIGRLSPFLCQLLLPKNGLRFANRPRM